MFKYNRKELKTWAKSKIPILWEKRLGIALALGAMLLLMSLYDFVQMLVMMAVFIALGILSLMYNRWIKVSLGVELILLGTVLATVLYGKTSGLIVGTVSLFLAEVMTDRFTYSTFISFIGIFTVVMVVPLLGEMSVTWKGIWMTVLYDAVIGPGYILVGSSPWRTLLFVVTHIMFNIWVFAFIAPTLFNLLA